MKSNPQPIRKPLDNHRVERPAQTGFSSPATHYNEPRIDLNTVLAPNTESTFYIRVVDDSFTDFCIERNDVLIVDKSLQPKPDQLIMVNSDGLFQIVRMQEDYHTEITIWGVITYIIKKTL